MLLARLEKNFAFGEGGAASRVRKCQKVPKRVKTEVNVSKKTSLVSKTYQKQW